MPGSLKERRAADLSGDLGKAIRPQEDDGDHGDHEQLTWVGLNMLTFTLRCRYKDWMSRSTRSSVMT